VDHDEENPRRAARALRADVRDGWEWNRAYVGRADATVAFRADRAGLERTRAGRVGCLSLVLRIEVLPNRGSMRRELLVRMRGHLLNRW
jgi:hypothetical protein